MNAQEDTISSIFTWTIEEFSTLKTEIYSMTFLAGSYEWRMRIYPRGDGDNIDKLEIYLYVVDSDNRPHGWNRFAQFDISVVDQVCGQYTVRKELQHKFDAQSHNWGYSSFMLLKDLHDPIKGFLVNNSLIVKVGISAGKIVEYHSYDSKKETGYVGLKNHGSISYINSRLQTLYHIPSFRKVIYHIPAEEKDMRSRSVSVALQRLFYELQYSNFGVATNDLFKSLEWDINGSITLDDLKELSMDLFEKLEDNAEETVEEGSIQELFMGHLINYIECINVDYSAKRPGLFYELQLDVKGCRDVYASFDKYVGVEHLEGHNKYHTTQHGLQNAKKVVLFTDFPPVLQLTLKRFDCDIEHDTMVEIYDQYDFPLELDLDLGNGKYLSPDADPGTRNLFILHRLYI